MLMAKFEVKFQAASRSLIGMALARFQKALVLSERNNLLRRHLPNLASEPATQLDGGGVVLDRE